RDSNRCSTMIRHIAILGAGTMGHGIAHAALSAGYEMTLFDVSSDALTKAGQSIDVVIRRGVELGKVATADADAMTGRLRTTTELADALSGADFVIEAAPGELALKLRLFAEIDRLAPEHAIVTSNTSALSITEMAATLRHPARV